MVNHNSVLSNLYSSSRVTPYEVTFTLSLERVMYYSPNVTWHDSWLAATAGDKPFADVYKVQGEFFLRNFMHNGQQFIISASPLL